MKGGKEEAREVSEGEFLIQKFFSKLLWLSSVQNAMLGAGKKLKHHGLLHTVTSNGEAFATAGTERQHATDLNSVLCDGARIFSDGDVCADGNLFYKEKNDEDEKERNKMRSCVDT